MASNHYMLVSSKGFGSLREKKKKKDTEDGPRGGGG